MILPARAVRLVLVALTLLWGAVPARAEDVKVFSSVAMRAVVEELAQRFERETGHRVVPTFGLAAAMKSRIEGGEAFDLAILTPAQIDDLIKQGKAAAASRAVIARTGLGLMVRAGASKLDVGTVDAFKRTLLTAKSLTYVPPPGASGAAFLAVVKQLGIAQALEAKTKAGTSAEEVIANITGGAAAIAVLPVSEILPVAGAELGGVFPAEIQSYIVMAAGINPRSPKAAAAREFVTFITSAKATPVVKAKGMER